MEQEIIYTFKINGEILRYESGDEEMEWDFREAVSRARQLAPEIGIHEIITLHLWHKRKALLRIKRLANGEVAEWGAEDSEEFNRYLKAEMIGCSPHQVGEYMPVGYVLSAHGNQSLFAREGWKPWNEGRWEKIYSSLRRALQRAEKEAEVFARDTIIINRRFRTPWGSEIDRQMAMLRKFAEWSEVEWSVNGAFWRGSDACTRNQVREMQFAGAGGDWYSYIGKVRPFRNKEREEKIF